MVIMTMHALKGTLGVAFDHRLVSSGNRVSYRGYRHVHFYPSELFINKGRTGERDTMFLLVDARERAHSAHTYNAMPFNKSFHYYEIMGDRALR